MPTLRHNGREWHSNGQRFQYSLPLMNVNHYTMKGDLLWIRTENLYHQQLRKNFSNELKRLNLRQYIPSLDSLKNRRDALVQNIDAEIKFYEKVKKHLNKEARFNVTTVHQLRRKHSL